MDKVSLIILNIVGLIIACATILGNFTRKKYKIRRKILFILAIDILVIVLSSLLNSIFYGINKYGVRILFYLFKSIELAGTTIFPLIMSIYIGYLIYEDEIVNKMFLKITISFAFLSFLMIFVNAIGPISDRISQILFTINSNGIIEYTVIGIIFLKAFNYISLFLSLTILLIHLKDLDGNFVYPCFMMAVPIILSDIYLLIFKTQELSFLYSLCALYSFYMSQATRKFNDELSGLANRPFLIDKIGRWLKSDSTFIIDCLLIDINDIDYINEIYGHANGDTVITTISKIVRNLNVKHRHLFPIRFRGKEFILLFKEKDRQELELYKEEFISELNKKSKIEGIDKPIDCSIGYYSISNKLLKNKEDYLKKLDEKMHYARNKMARLIDDYIENDKFFVYYQPIFNLKLNKFTKIEALLRAKDENGNFINPETIINCAENTSIEMISKLGRIITEKVCRYCSCEEFKALGIDIVDINLSGRQCVSENISESLISIIDKYNLPHEMFNFELTETALQTEEEIIKSNLNTLEESNISLSLDDFGKGYSNLQKLIYFPLNSIKIDKSLVDNFEDKNVEIVLTHIIDMCKDLEYEIVIEGIETEKQYQYFKDKCDYIQGYYYSKPRSEDDLINFIKKYNAK